MVDAVTGTLASGATINAVAKIVETIDMAQGASKAFKQGSLTAIAGAARVEPLTIVDSEVIHLDYLTDVLQSAQSIFAGYYLQAISMIADVGNVQVARVLDKLNPARTADRAVFIKELAGSMEGYVGPSYKLDPANYRWRLPMSGNTPALEAEREDIDTRARASIDSKQMTSINELSNLSVGKLINVTISSNGQSAVVPIAIRLIVNELPASSLMSLLGVGQADESFVERYYQWRAGRINFIRDLILCQDMIKNKKKMLMHDKSGILTEIQTRSKNNKIAAFMTKTPSLGAASNIFVISANTASELKRRYGVDVDSARSREKVFEEINGMLLVVIDSEYDRVKFYHRDTNLPTSVGIRDIRAANKNGGPNITDILQAYKMGESPTL